VAALRVVIGAPTANRFSMNALSGEGPRYRHCLVAVQRRRMLALRCGLVLAVVLLPIVRSMWPAGGPVHESIETIGLVMIGIAVLGRAWCTLYIGGRKSQGVVDTGPYSISRNPLYVFSLIGGIGIGAQTGSLVTALAFGLVAFLVFLPVIFQEEKMLSAVFGDAYREYSMRIPRFGPRPSTWKDVEVVSIRPSLLWRTVRDSLIFFLAIPLFEIIDWLQLASVIRPIIWLP
jgi:protein-S-isoprenylcysteine O-methyltransferase Ste14